MLLAHESAVHVTDFYKNLHVKPADNVMTDTKLFELLRQFAEAIVDETGLRGIP